jgi:hypothetical protein
MALLRCVVWLLPVVINFGCDRHQTQSVKPQSNGKATESKISANPNPVPAGVGDGTTTITWDTGDGSMGEVYVSVNGLPEKLFFRGAKGTRDAPWINDRGICTFSLYRGTNHVASDVLASVTVRKMKVTSP